MSQQVSKSPLGQRCLITFVLACSTVLSVSCDEPRTREPPLECEIFRGAWCILSGSYELTLSHVANRPLYQWSMTESHWRSEAGLILESAFCPKRHADVIQVVRVSERFEWSGKHWRQVVVRLTSDGACELQLLAPARELAPLDMAASALSTHIAACFVNKPCTDHLIADEVFGHFGVNVR